MVGQREAGSNADRPDRASCRRADYDATIGAASSVVIRAGPAPFAHTAS
jgi:hypothetical protein